MTRALALAALVLAADALPAAELPPKEAALLARLEARIRDVDSRLDGVLGVFVRDLATGAVVERRPDERFPTASSMDTRLRRLMMDTRAAARGEENDSTPREMARLAEIVGRGEGLRGPLAADLLAVATVADEGSPFRRGLPEGVRAVSKPARASEYGRLLGHRPSPD